MAKELRCDGRRRRGGLGGDFLRRSCPHLWVDAEGVKSVDLTVVVFDRFNGRIVEGAGGVMDELAPTEPIRASPLRAGRKRTPGQEVQLQLYSHTHRDGAGWHYEWLSASSSGGGGHVSAGTAASSGLASAS